MYLAKDADIRPTAVNLGAAPRMIGGIVALCAERQAGIRRPSASVSTAPLTSKKSMPP